MTQTTLKRKLENLIVCLIDKNGRSVWHSQDPKAQASKPGMAIVDMVAESDTDKVMHALGRVMLKGEEVEYDVTGIASQQTTEKVPWGVKLLPINHADLSAVCMCYRLPDNVKEINSDEREMVGMLAADCTLKEIADKLFCSESTIDTKMRQLKSKLGVRNIGGLVACSIMMGLV